MASDTLESNLSEYLAVEEVRESPAKSCPGRSQSWKCVYQIVFFFLPNVLQLFIFFLPHLQKIFETKLCLKWSPFINYLQTNQYIVWDMGSIFQEKQIAIVTYNVQLVMQKWNALEIGSAL